MKRRSHRYEKMARVYDDEILPVWSRRFGRMLLRGLLLPEKAMVLDVGCGTGYPALELIKQMDGGRIIAIEALGPLLDVARKKAGELAGKSIFLRTESISTELGFADEVYDLVVSNLGLLERPDPAGALREFARVAKTGARVCVTLPLLGTYSEFYDIYREVLTRRDEHEVLARLESHIAELPDADQAAQWMEAAGLHPVEVEVEEFRLLFQSSREFFFAPVIEYGPLTAWKAIAGDSAKMQETFWAIKESIDAYFGGRAFEVTIKAGCLRGSRPPDWAQRAAPPRAEAAPPAAPDAAAEEPPELDALSWDRSRVEDSSESADDANGTAEDLANSDTDLAAGIDLPNGAAKENGRSASRAADRLPAGPAHLGRVAPTDDPEDDECTVRRVEPGLRPN